MKTTAYKFIKLLGKVVFGLPFLLAFVNCSGQKKFILKEERTITLNSERTFSPGSFLFNIKEEKFYALLPTLLFTYKFDGESFYPEKTDTVEKYGCATGFLLEDYSRSTRCFVYVAPDNKQSIYKIFRPSRSGDIKCTHKMPVSFTDSIHIYLDTKAGDGFVLPGDILVGCTSANAAIWTHRSYTPIFFIKLLPNNEIRIIDTIGIPIPSIYEVEKYGMDKYFFPFYLLVLGGYNPNENSFIAGHCLGNTFYKISDIHYNKDTTKILRYSIQSFEIHSEYFVPDSIEIFSGYTGKSQEKLLHYMNSGGAFNYVKYDPEQEIYLQSVTLPTDYSGFDRSYLNFSIIAYDKNLQKIGEYVVFNNNGKMFPFFTLLSDSRLAFVDGEAYRKGEAVLRVYKYKLE